MASKSEKDKAWEEFTTAFQTRSGIPPFFTGTEEVRSIFNERAQLQRWLDIEAALAMAEAEVGLIPQEAARAPKVYM